LSPAIALNTIVVKKWDEPTKISTCVANFVIDGSALLKLARDGAPSISNPYLKPYLQGLDPAKGAKGAGRIAYSVSPIAGSRDIYVQILEIQKE
jgi:hypothetical protein